MDRFFDIIQSFGPIVMSALSMGYLIMVKVSHIDEIKETLKRMDETIERKLDCISQRQIDHEGRISRIEGRMNGK